LSAANLAERLSHALELLSDLDWVLRILTRGSVLAPKKTMNWTVGRLFWVAQLMEGFVVFLFVV
jgi:hypothetical protein